MIDEREIMEQWKEKLKERTREYFSPEMIMMSFEHVEGNESCNGYYGTNMSYNSRKRGSRK